MWAHGQLGDCSRQQMTMTTAVHWLVALIAVSNMGEETHLLYMSKLQTTLLLIALFAKTKVLQI